MLARARNARLWLLLLTVPLLMAAAPQVTGLLRGRVVHSFAPTPLFRGVVGQDGQRAQAEILFNHRGFGFNAENEPAQVELAIDVIAVDRETGRKLGDFCTTRIFPMEAPLDLKSIRLQVTETGVRFEWPNRKIEDVFLFQPGSNVEVSILALALRGDGRRQSPIERASLRVNGDLDGDGVLEFNLFRGADYQPGSGFTS